MNGFPPAVIRQLPACCMDLEIALEHLAFPFRLGAEGMEFIRAHGILDVPLGDLMAGAEDKGDKDGRATVRIYHRCQHLQDNGACDIYARRPKICRDFDCSKRQDCACDRESWAPAGLLQIEGL